MADPKGLVYQGQGGTGYAAIVDMSPDPGLQRQMDDLINLKWRQKQQQQEERKKQQDFISKLGTYDALIEQSQPEMDEDYRKIRDYYAEAASMGYNPMDPTNPVGKTLLDLVNKFETKDTMNKTFVAQKNAILQEYMKNPDKYDTEHLHKTMEDVLNVEGVAGRAKAWEQSTPLVPKVELFKELDQFLPGVETKTTDTGYLKKTRSGPDVLDPMSTEISAKKYLMTYPEEEAYLIRTGKAKDSDEVLDMYKSEMRSRIPKTESEDRTIPTSGGGLNINFGAGSAESGDWKLSAASNPSYPGGGKEGVNVVTVAYKDQDAKPLALTGWNGETVYLKPEKIRKNKRGETTQWVVEGKRAKRLTGDQVEKMKAAGDFSFDQDPETGEYVSIKETETVNVPVSNHPGSLGEVNYRTISDRTGVDFYEFVGGVNKERGAGQSTDGFPDIDPN